MHLSYADLCEQLNAWKAETGTAFKAVHSQVLQQALKDLDCAYRTVFEGRIALPRHKKGQDDAVRHPQGVRFGQPNGRIDLPKLGWVRYRASRFVDGGIGRVTASRHVGRWFVSGPDCARRSSRRLIRPQASSASTWVWRGSPRSPTARISSRWTDSERPTRRSLRRQGGSRRSRRIARIRPDFLHKASTRISKNHAVICVEDLDVLAMLAGDEAAARAGRVRDTGG